MVDVEVDVVLESSGVLDNVDVVTPVGTRDPRIGVDESVVVRDETVVVGRGCVDDVVLTVRGVVEEVEVVTPVGTRVPGNVVRVPIDVVVDDRATVVDVVDVDDVVVVVVVVVVVLVEEVVEVVSDGGGGAMPVVVAD